MDFWLSLHNDHTTFDKLTFTLSTGLEDSSLTRNQRLSNNLPLKPWQNWMIRSRLIVIV